MYVLQKFFLGIGGGGVMNCGCDLGRYVSVLRHGFRDNSCGLSYPVSDAYTEASSW